MFIYVTQAETDCIAIGSDIRVTVLSIEGDVVRFRIDTPDDRRIFVIDRDKHGMPLLRRPPSETLRRRGRYLS